MLTTTEVCRKTGIPMPRLIKLRKIYGGVIPSTGEGSKVRYPPEAVDIFLRCDEMSTEARRNERYLRATGRWYSSGQMRLF